jgi:hypothetical protein
MWDFFSSLRDPSAGPPAILQVCRPWRHITINDPRYWTILTIHSDSSLDIDDLQGPADRKAKAGAIQETINQYFDRSKGIWWVLLLIAS